MIDSWATHHICAHKVWFAKYLRCPGGKFVSVADGSHVPIMGVGNVQVKVCDGRIITLHGI